MDKNGFSLLECILALSLFSLILTLCISIYLTGYRIYREQEYRIETEQHVRVVLNRISHTLRKNSNVNQSIFVSDGELIIGNIKYYLMNNIVYERIDGGTNSLGYFISKFEPKLENGYLRVIVEAEINPDYKPFSLEKIYFVGDE
ncbi:MAG: prepilin-type N-terminal cleavage/methylation domain-containing protein [Clostridiales bacterium]|nr:prepilin-type N-terminal cleavage/methylation domain-containing protein [Clostridiales bacterium]